MPALCGQFRYYALNTPARVVKMKHWVCKTLYQHECLCRLPQICGQFTNKEIAEYNTKFNELFIGLNYIRLKIENYQIGKWRSVLILFQRVVFTVRIPGDCSKEAKWNNEENKVWQLQILPKESADYENSDTPSRTWQPESYSIKINN